MTLVNSSKTRMTKDRWTALYEEWQSSGESQSSFCKRKDINYHVFVYWRKKHSAKIQPKISKKTFAAVKLAGTPNQPVAHARVIMNNGIQIIIPADYPKSAMLNLLQLFGAASC